MSKDVQQLQEERTRVQEQLQAARNERLKLQDDRDPEALADRAARQAASRQREGAARALLGEPGPAPAASATAEAVERIEALEAREEELAAERDRLDQQLNETVREQFPDALAREGKAVGKLRGSLADLGRAVLAEYGPAREAREQLAAARERVQRLEGAYSPEDRRLGQRQRQEVRSHRDQLCREATAEERLGYLILRLLDWSRLGSSPVEALWREKGISLRSGSVLHQRPVLQEDLFKLDEGELPI